MNQGLGGRTLKGRIKSLIPRAVLTRDLGTTRGKQVLFTFDDGPDREVTPAVLDLLDAFGARAIFFVVGRRVAEAPELLRLIRARGHRIGNHSFRHRRPPVREYISDLIYCQELLRDHLGEAPRLYRPPGGHLSAASLTVPLLLGMRTVNWSLDVRDYTCRNRPQALAAARTLASSVRPGHIVLLHDDQPGVLDILEYALPRLVARGFDLGSAADLV
ncbi:MAG TPA: polysaccharide deacetylase family protein [Kofleriaceae bacterium]|nr:polysaccharide deacetylase family protein [Kofleriaceae bacterium]